MTTTACPCCGKPVDVRRTHPRNEIRNNRQRTLWVCFTCAERTHERPCSETLLEMRGM